MSYCVNCGVELDSTHSNCPLCNTPVINPAQLIDATKPTPFSQEKGQVEVVKKKDLAIFLSVVLTSASITCALLNLLVFNQNMWSLAIIGVCAIIWVFAIPAVIYTKLSIYTSIFLDGVVVGVYTWLITKITISDVWFFELSLPIIILVTVLIEILIFLLRHFRVSFLATALYLFVEAAILCVGIEIFIDLFLNKAIALSWSAVVLTACTIIAIALITLLSKKRLRNAVRRRLHF